jgi:putative tricarboxylic transport membrane protein
MAASDNEIVVEDPTAPAPDSPVIVHTRSVDVVTSALLFLLAVLLCYDNWQTGMGWSSVGPEPGYFPFYLGVLLAAASLYGIFKALVGSAGASEPFVTRDQLWRVMQVFVPTLVFCILTQWLGIYVASFLLTAGFMRIIGRISWWVSLLTGFLFSLLMFITFDVAFDVIMPKGPLEAFFGH